MIERPDWLPPMIRVNGDWKQVLAGLYTIFEKDFKQTKCKFGSAEVWWDRRILENECYEEGFWHLITRINKKTKERLFDPRRAERLPWCAPVIANANDKRVKVWDFREGKGDIRSYLWLEELDYVVILTKRKLRFGDAIFLITAYYVDGDYQRRVLQRKYSNREA
jgi:hypothetical protein